jgi:hypothetical protein
MKKSLISLSLLTINFFPLDRGHPPLLTGEGTYGYRLPVRSDGIGIQATSVIGTPQIHFVQKEDTLLDIA